MVFFVTVFIFLFISNAYATGCLGNYDDELHHYILLNSEVSKKISELGIVDQNTIEQYKKSIANDPIGIELEQSKKCLGSMNTTSSTNDYNSILSNPFTGAIIGSIIGAFVVIVGSEKLQRWRIIKNGKTAIKIQLQGIKEILEQKTQFSNGTMTFRYSPYVLSTTALDSAVSSGAFLHFPIDLQRNLDIIYFQIKEHNTLLQKLTDVIIKTQMENVLPETEQVLLRYYEEIVINQELIYEKYLKNITDLL